MKIFSKRKFRKLLWRPELLLIALQLAADVHAGVAGAGDGGLADTVDAVHLRNELYGDKDRKISFW